MHVRAAFCSHLAFSDAGLLCSVRDGARLAAWGASAVDENGAAVETAASWPFGLIAAVGVLAGLALAVRGSAEF